LDVISIAQKWSFFSPLKLLLYSNPFEIQDTISKAKELASEKPVQALSPDMLIQVGAFLHESNASSLRERLSALLNKNVIIVQVDGYFKVRITGFTSSEEMEKLIPALGLLGIKNIWVFRVKKKEDIISQVVVQSDTSLKATKDKINVPVVAEDKRVLAETTINLQVGVFHSRSEALRAQRRITTKLNLPVEIVKEWEYYIVFITGFKTRDEIFKYYPKLAALGYPDSFMIEINNLPVQKN
jgi:cell division protein FtsN